MAKSEHRPHDRIVLPNGMYVLLYHDGENVKIGGFNRRFELDRLTTHTDEDHPGAAMHFRVSLTADEPREIVPRANDLVCVPRGSDEARQAGVS